MPGFATTFLVDGKPPAAGAVLRQRTLAATLDHLAHAGLDDFYRGDVGREIAADLERIGSPVTRRDLETLSRPAARAARAVAGVGHALQHAAADAGARLADHPRPVRAPARHGGRELRPRPWPGRGDQARVPRPRPRHHRFRPPDAAGRSLPRCALARRGGRQDRSPQGGRLAGPVGRRRHHLDGRGRRVRPRRLLHPVALLGVRLGLRAAAHRRADAEPRRELLARPRRPQSAGARPPPVPHAQPGARRAARTAASMAYGTMGGDGQPQTQAARLHPPRAVSPAARPRRSTRRAGCSAAPGARRTPICGWSRASTAT